MLEMDPTGSSAGEGCGGGRGGEDGWWWFKAGRSMGDGEVWRSHVEHGGTRILWRLGEVRHQHH